MGMEAGFLGQHLLLEDGGHLRIVLCESCRVSLFKDIISCDLPRRQAEVVHVQVCQDVTGCPRQAVNMQEDLEVLVGAPVLHRVPHETLLLPTRRGADIND
jgi:hypothetical protein